MYIYAKYNTIQKKQKYNRQPVGRYLQKQKSSAKADTSRIKLNNI